MPGHGTYQSTITSSAQGRGYVVFYTLTWTPRVERDELGPPEIVVEAINWETIDPWQLTLYSPQSLIAEGSATYGVHVVFPDEAAYLKDVLFPLAGLPPEHVEVYLKVEALVKTLRYADIEAARRFLDGRSTSEQTRDYLVRYRLLSPQQVEKFLVNTVEDRTYVINYSLGRDIVADFSERKGGTDQNPVRRWEILRELLSSPVSPEDLRAPDS